MHAFREKEAKYQNAGKLAVFFTQSNGFLVDFAARPRPGARQDVAALAAFLASFGGGAGLNRRERCGCVMVCLKRMGFQNLMKLMLFFSGFLDH